MMMTMKAGALATVLVVLLLLGIAWYAFSRATSDAAIPNPTILMQIASPEFAYGARIPAKFTCDADAPPSPALEFSGVPDGAVSLALVMDDPDVPAEVRPERNFDHWVLFDIPPETPGIPEGGSAGTKGANGRGAPEYAGPCPPPQYEPSEHRYYFRLYALDTMLSLPEGATKQEVLDAMLGHVIEEAHLMGTYRRAVE